MVQRIDPPIVAQMLWGDVRIHHLREDKHGHLFVQLEIQNTDTSVEQKLLLREFWTEDRGLKVTIEDAEHAYYNDLTGRVEPNPTANETNPTGQDDVPASLDGNPEPSQEV